MTIYFLTVFGLYFFLLTTLMLGWNRVFSHQPNRNSSGKFISVVIAVRNEGRNIRWLIGSLLEQQYPASGFEIIVVNDHSTDNTLEVLQPMASSAQNFSILSLTENEAGKKEALAKGILNARGKIIATTDADCQLPPDWLIKIDQVFSDEQCQMAVGLVSLQQQNLFSKLQSLEFAGVMGVTFGTLGWRIPTMCNGANLAFWKSTFEQVNGYAGNEHIASGDDEFLMRKIQARFPGSVVALNSLVVTQPQASARDFFRQRIRWAGKWKVNSSFFAKSLAVFIWLFQASWVMLWVSAGLLSVKYFLTFLLSKIIIDLIFLLTVANRLNTAFNFFIFLLLQLVYPFYVFSVGILSWWKKVEWKGRKI